MAHFAKVTDGIVTNVIVAEPEFFDTFVDTVPGEWIQCSYNTRGGVHTNGGTPLRKNYPGIGYVYDKVRDAFYVRKPYPSWTLDENTCFWVPPVPHPDDNDNFYNWNEADQTWDLVTPE
jgi:hypothetical protein